MKNIKLSHFPAFYFGALDFSSLKLYAISTILAIGNILLVFLSHYIYIGNTVAGKVILPLYFFTLVGTYYFGARAGFLTAFFSLIASRILAHMPADPVLFPVTLKLLFLIAFTSFIARETGKPTLSRLVYIVAGYQLAGTLIGLLFHGNLSFSDYPTAVPGLLLQVFGGYVVLNILYATTKLRGDQNPLQGDRD